MQATPKEYYQHLYPYQKLVDLLTCNGDELANIEFAIEGAAYKRYLSVRSAQELKAAVSDFPEIATFHFGAIYSYKPSSNPRLSVPVRRVLSFDIDLTDKAWLELGQSGVEAARCDKAWPVCAASIEILKRLLGGAFGYTRFLVVYSGRRGAHVHVLDDAAMDLSSEARAAIVAYINGNPSKDDMRCAEGVRQVMTMHGMRKDVYRCFRKRFVEGMGLFDSCAARAEFVRRLNLDRYESLKHAADLLADEVMGLDSGKEVWGCIREKVVAMSAVEPWVVGQLDRTLLAYVWPVLDENVTRDIAHLTKVPFACHAKSGRVACAIGADAFWSFDPGSEAPKMASWNQDLMDAALAHFHDGAAPDRPAEGEGRGGEGASVDAVVAGPDMEDLAGRPREKPRSGNGSRKLTWKRKQSPLVPQL
jgi:predicted DNA primase small subunit